MKPLLDESVLKPSETAALYGSADDKDGQLHGELLRLETAHDREIV